MSQQRDGLSTTRTSSHSRRPSDTTERERPGNLAGSEPPRPDLSRRSGRCRLRATSSASVRVAFWNQLEKAARRGSTPGQLPGAGDCRKILRERTIRSVRGDLLPHKLEIMGTGMTVGEALRSERIRGLRVSEPARVGPETSLAETIRAMREARIGCALVCDQGRIVGI